MSWSPTYSAMVLLAEALGERDDGVDDELVGGVGQAMGDELAVDLEVVEGQVLQVVEAAEPGAEVVEGEGAAECRQAVGELAGSAEVGDGRGLGDLERELGRVDTWRLGEAPFDEREQIGVAHRDAGQVDLERQGRWSAWVASAAMAWSTTHRSMRLISPNFSATPRNVAGLMISPSSSIIRSNSSWRVIVRVARSMIGWANSVNRSWSRASVIRSTQASRALVRRLCCRSARGWRSGRVRPPWRRTSPGRR